MAKKTKDQVPNVNSVTNRDIIQRLSFLYQASTYLNTISSVSSSSSSSASTSSTSPSTSSASTSSTIPSTSNATTQHDPPTKKNRRRTQTRVTTQDLSKSYITSMKIVGQKTTVKMDPAIKRTLCKSCQTVLIPGLSASVRIKGSPSHGHVVTYTCVACKMSRRIPAPPTLASASISVSISSEQDVDQSIRMMTDVPMPMTMLDASTRRKRSKGPRIMVMARLPPLSARRDAGHVVFCGNERVVDGVGVGVGEGELGNGNGLYIA